MSEDEVAGKVEAACTELSGYSVWLPEHLNKTGESLDEGEAIVDRAAGEFRSSLESLDPPDDLRDPIEQLEEGPQGSPSTPGGLTASLRKEAALYDEVGASRCARATRASILSLNGASVTAAYHRVGIPLPPRPEGW